MRSPLHRPKNIDGRGSLRMRRVRDSTDPGGRYPTELRLCSRRCRRKGRTEVPSLTPSFFPWPEPDTLDDARAAVVTAPGLIRLREDAARGRDDTERQWTRALARAATFTADPGQAPREPIDDELDAIEHALAVTTAHWGRRGGASDERILHALTALARTARTRVLDIDCRRLGQTCALDASTVSRRLRVLAREGWVTLTTPSAGTRAARWTLNQPPDGGVEITSNATQGNPPPLLRPGSRSSPTTPTIYGVP